MLQRVLPFLLLLLLALPLHAEVIVSPAGPTTRTPVSLIVTGSTPDTCSEPGRAPSITITEEKIEVAFERYLGVACLGAGYPWTRHVELGLLPAGRYELTATYRQFFKPPSVAGTAQIIVGDAGPAIIEPAGTPYDAPGEIYFRFPPEYSVEDVAKVTFGDDEPLATTVSQLTSFLRPGVVRPRPRREPGTVDVTIEDRDGEKIVMRNAFTFYDRAAAPDPRVFEPILIPIVFSGPGAHGTQWRTDVTLFPAGGEGWGRNVPLATFRPIHSQPVTAATFQPDLLGQRPRGVIIHAARSTAAGVRFAATVRELSRRNPPARVPVVRESDLRDQMTFVGVPVSPRFRAKLRVYTVEPSTHLRATFSSFTVLARPLELIRAADDEPYYAELDLEPYAAMLRNNGEVAEDGVYTLAVWQSSASSRPPPFWAWITLTDNETQMMTFLTED